MPPDRRLASDLPRMDGLTIRDGTDADLSALTEIEARSFASDRLSRRSLRRFLSTASARLRVARADGKVLGYYLVLHRAGSTLARLYSVAVDRRARGSGLGARLVADAEGIASRLGRKVLRLEVRADNLQAIRLYERHGYCRIGAYRQYYADKTDALRYEKHIGPGIRGRSPARQSPDSDEDRSPADFGVSNPSMTLSRQPAAPGTPRAALPFAAGPPASPRRPRGREA